MNWNFEPDKRLHFAAGVIIFLCVAVVFGGVYGLIASGVVGLLKEAYDGIYPEKHTVDIFDAIYTWFGGIIAFLIWGILGGL